MKNKISASKFVGFLFVLMTGLSNTYAQSLPNSHYTAGTELDLVTPVGQLVIGNGYDMIHAPFGDSRYWHILSMRHENPLNNYTTQIAGEFFGSRLAFRNIQNQQNVSWNEIYHSGNINTLKEAIANSGNIGIGTIAPQEKLSVNGKIRAHEIKVETTNWPDYVFDPAYQLIPLKELENYIKVNKHLPQMPTAEQVVANGIQLGEMNNLLVKKVEELTLHLIDKDKQIDNLLQRLEAVEKIIKK